MEVVINQYEEEVKGYFKIVLMRGHISNAREQMNEAG